MITMKSESKKILLTAINAKYIHSNPAVYSLKACNGMLSDHVQIKEYTINSPSDFILQDIFLQRPLVLCFSCYIWNIDIVLSISAEYKKLCPTTPIWLGGPEVSFETESFLKEHPFITGIMTGEGEVTFRELCIYYLSLLNRENNKTVDVNPKEDFYCDNESPSIGFGDSFYDNAKSCILSEIPGIGLKKITGITFRSSLGEIIKTPSRPLTSLDDIPFIYQDAAVFKNRIIYYESSRGCPFSCSYCLSSVDKTLRVRSLERVYEELLFFLRSEVPQVKFIDRTFNCDHERAFSIWQFIRDNDNGVTNFHFEIAADLLNDKELEILCSMRPALVQLEIGVQTVNPHTLREIRRSMDIDRLKTSVGFIRRAGNIHQHLDLIAGLPYEDYLSFQNSFDDVIALWPDQLQLGFLKVLKGSYMYEKAPEYDLLFHNRAPYEVLSTKWLSFDDMINIKAVEEMLEVYYNSSQYEITMKLVYVMAKSMFDFFLKLGIFYKEREYNGMNHSRIKRCEILLEFFSYRDDSWLMESTCEDVLLAKESPVGGRPRLMEHTGGESGSIDISPKIDMDMIKEALIFDLYLRENCKTRPGWAVDVSALRKMTHLHCKNGKLSHIEPFHYAFPYERIWNMEKLPKRMDKPQWMLFHYDKRNPLDHQAQLETVDCPD